MSVRVAAAKIVFDESQMHPRPIASAEPGLDMSLDM
jgi:hypothetical protein